MDTNYASTMCKANSNGFIYTVTSHKFNQAANINSPISNKKLDSEK